MFSLNRTASAPWVVKCSQDAEVLLQAALSLPYARTVSVVVPEENRAVVELLSRHGFETVRVNRHMGRGATSPAQQNLRTNGSRAWLSGRTRSLVWLN